MGVDKRIEKIIKNRDFWILAIILIFGFYSGLFKDLFNSLSFNSDETRVARLEIDDGNKKRAFEGEIISGMSVLDALTASSKVGDFEVRYALINDSTDIMDINGLAEDGISQKKWNFYLNGEKIDAALAHKIQIGPGDKILVKFE